MTARILWVDGLPLGPQHLQEADRLSRDALDARVRAMHGLSWGTRRLTLDSRLLREGVIRVVELEAVLPSGTVVSIGANDPTTIEDRPVTGLGPERRRVSVSLALTREAHGRPELGGPSARLRRMERTSLDVHTETPADPITLELGVPALRIVFGHEPHGDLETLPIGTVTRDERGEVRLEDEIVGPLLAIRASPPLLARLGRLVERLGARRAALIATRHERDDLGVDVDVRDLPRFLLASTIATHIPVLRHHLRNDSTTPLALFERLLSLAGALSILAVDAELDLPDLDPVAPQAAFAAVFERIDALLAATDRERARVLPLEPRSDGLHFARIDEETSRGERFYLAVHSTLAAREVESSLGGLAKVASFGEIASVLDSATPGAPLRVVHRPPPEVPIKAGETCFELPVADRHFRAALAERGIAVYLPARAFDPAHTRLTLVAVARHGSGERVTDREAPAIGA